MNQDEWEEHYGYNHFVEANECENDGDGLLIMEF